MEASDWSILRTESSDWSFMQAVIESCPFKSGMSFVVGGALGAFMGLFSSSIAPHHTVQVNRSLIDGPQTQ